ncbi:MAG: hypothetical protein HY364_01825 [Candidatus Aenigmarchaeota archaeon]|nr:hypothetical protein [Candidatus Aenigmarchaeota archaeon]
MLKLVEDLDNNKSRVLTEMAKAGMSPTAYRIAKSHNYVPHACGLYVPADGNIDELHRDPWYMLFLDKRHNGTDIGKAWRQLPPNYEITEVGIYTENGNMTLRIVYNNKDERLAILDEEGHFGILSPSKNPNAVTELAYYFNILPSIKEPPSAFSDIIKNMAELDNI